VGNNVAPGHATAASLATADATYAMFVGTAIDKDVSAGRFDWVGGLGEEIAAWAAAGKDRHDLRAERARSLAGQPAHREADVAAEAIERGERDGILHAAGARYRLAGRADAYAKVGRR